MLGEGTKVEERVYDQASLASLRKAEAEGVETCFMRMEMQKGQCKTGKAGLCCRICHMGPCRISEKTPRGVCGANADTVVARNYLREVVGGTAAHSDHGRHLVLLLKKVAQGKSDGYGIKDEEALRRTARLYKIREEGRSREEIAMEVATLFLAEFTSQEDLLQTLNLAPRNQQEMWKKYQVTPLGIDRMVVESMHRTTMGVDHDYKNILMQAFRTSLSDGWGGSRIATMVSDILFGTPFPVRGNANFGVLGRDTVNIIVHGHEPEVSEILALAVQDPEIVEYAKKAGAKGVTLAGICCTANEILMRHGIPVAGNFLQQELAIVTGAVEMMITDVQCCMPSLPDIAKAYHTELISTSDIAKTVGTAHFRLGEGDPRSKASELMKRAIDNFKNRDPAKVAIPSNKKQLVAGFSVEAIKYMLGGTFRASFRPLNDAIIQGRIKGVAGIVGCNNPKIKMDSYINRLTEGLIQNDILVLKTGCAAIASAKEGLLLPEAMGKAGRGLKEVCETVGMPPVLHMGSCVDNSRLLEAGTEMVWERGLGDDLSQLPVVGVAPEWMSEKAIAIGSYFVASGIDVVLGHPFYISGSENVTRFLSEEVASLFGASFHVCEDPDQAVTLILHLIEKSREKLGINKKMERELYDMKARRNLDV